MILLFFLGFSFMGIDEIFWQRACVLRERYHVTIDEFVSHEIMDNYPFGEGINLWWKMRRYKHRGYYPGETFE